ncbi:MAG: efflux RND transporter periplasmic adaptor subunit, partial [Vibrio sp.]
GSIEAYNIARSISLVAKLEAKTSIEVKPEVAGKIERILVTSNQKVKKGDVLVELERLKEIASVEEARAYLNDEQRKASEYQQLIKRNAISKTELAAQKASASIAQARLNVALADLADMTIKAPFDGTVGLIDLSQGKMLSSGDSLFTLDDLSVMRLDVQVPERYLSQIKTGMDVETLSSAWGDRTFVGKVTHIDSRVDPSSLSVATRLEIPNSQGLLKPGMLMSANLVFPDIRAPIIPVQALEYSGTKRYVYVLNSDNTVTRTEVFLGARVGEKIVVEKGIEVGQTIVTQGLVNMRDGMPVKILHRYDPQTGKELTLSSDEQTAKPREIKED